MKEIAEVRASIQELTKHIKHEEELLNLYITTHNNRLKRIEKQQRLQGISIGILFVWALYTLLKGL